MLSPLQWRSLSHAEKEVYKKISQDANAELGALQLLPEQSCSLT
jgi:hypothetical protein